MRAAFGYLLVVSVLAGGSLRAQTTNPSPGHSASQEEMDRDLLEVTIPQLETFYSSHKYTVTQVVQWYLAHREIQRNLSRGTNRQWTERACPGGTRRR
jgi:hypothetical protein